MSILNADQIEGLIREGTVGVAGDGLPPSLKASPDIRKLLLLKSAKWELRIGSEYSLLSEATDGLIGDVIRDLAPNGSFVLAPGDLALIKTRERIRLPGDLCANVTSKLGPTLFGLGGISTVVDPGFSGHLVIALANSGGHRLQLRWNDPIATLTVMRLSQPVAAAEFPRNQDGDLFSILYTTDLKYWFERMVGIPVPDNATPGTIVDLYRHSTSWAGTPQHNILQRITAIERSLRQWESRALEELESPERQ